MHSQSILEQASEPLRRVIADLAFEIRLAEGETLFAQGDVGDALYFVDGGAVEISVLSSDGRKFSLNVMRQGDVFGEIALLDGSPRTATAIAFEPCILRCVRRDDLLAQLKHRSDLAFDFIQLLCGRLRWVHELLEDRAFLPLSCRVAKRLLVLCDQLGQPSGAIAISQAELADFLGATREGVAKILGSFRAIGIIDLSRGSITIRNTQALRNATKIRNSDPV